jgi:hypothetical protein
MASRKILTGTGRKIMNPTDHGPVRQAADQDG